MLWMDFRRAWRCVTDGLAIGLAELLLLSTRGSLGNGKLQIAVIRATSHDEAPASDEQLQSALAEIAAGSNPSTCTHLIASRSHKAGNWAVALKCLILIHNGFELLYGGLISQPDCLDLASFEDRSSPFAAEQASSWVQWYAKFLQERVQAWKRLRNCGFDVKEGLSSMETDAMVRQIVMIHEVSEVICDCPPLDGDAAKHSLVREALELVILDSLTIQDELRAYLREAHQRLGKLNSWQISQCSQVCGRLLTDSKTLIRLIELGLASRLLESNRCPPKIHFLNHELMEIHKSLQSCVPPG